jgi:HEPN domain-containing protein
MRKPAMITARWGSVASNFHDQAEEFLDAAQIVYGAPEQFGGAIGLAAISLKREVRTACGSRAPFALNFCVQHAAELFLKSYLADRGMKAATLRDKFGHDIGKLIDAANAEGLQVAQELEEILRALVEENEKHVLRYQETHKPISLPSAQLFIQLVSSLGQSVLMARLNRDRSVNRK